MSRPDGTVSDELLDEIEDFLDQRADADCQGDPPSYVPNKAMRLLDQLKRERGGE